MSGIVALFDRDGGVDRADIRAMVDRIDHRGPDGSGLWVDDDIGLGHQHLRSTPEAQYDDQPYRDGDLVVVADARIDNRGELIETLDPAGPPGQVPDSQLLLEAYRRWDEQCVEHLLGAFAVVVWDADRERVFCARDRFGVKPLYYHRTGETFAAASEMKALLALPFVSRAVDELAVADFLAGSFHDKERTYYRSLARLPPAHALVVGGNDRERWRYWELDPTRTITLESDAAYERRFRELFEQAVRCRLRSNSPVGTALSGGMDSSSITVMARELLPSTNPLHTFSNVYDDAPASDEREFIKAVADRDGITPHYVFMDDVGSFEDVDRMMRHYDLPPHDPMHHAIWERVDRANEAGVGVVMEGALGDSATGYGLGLLAELLRTGRWRRLWEELRALSERGGAPKHKVFVHNALSPLVPPPVSRWLDRLQGEPVLTEKQNPTIDPGFATRTRLQHRLKRRKETWLLFRETARRRQRRSLEYGMVTASIETSDLAHAAFGVEPRYPFTDARLVEFSLAMPPSQQLSDGVTRSIIRRSLDDLLPETVRTRLWKTDMSQGFWNSLSNEEDRLRALLDDPGPLTEFVDPTALREAYDRFSNDPTTRDARALWRALSLSVWIERYDIDTRPASAE